MDERKDHWRDDKARKTLQRREAAFQAFERLKQNDSAFRYDKPEVSRVEDDLFGWLLDGVRLSFLQTKAEKRRAGFPTGPEVERAQKVQANCG